MQNRILVIYLLILLALCACVVAGSRALGRQGAYLAQVYMLTPALAAIISRAFFHKPRFRDANLRVGRAADYASYWLLSLGIVALFFVSYTLLGAITWDPTGRIFLTRLAQQFADAGQDMTASLPPGVTPQTMLLIYFFGGLTIFNIFPGVLTGLGEELGHRGLMFPLLYRIRPWAGFVIGGLIWFAWHLPLMLIIPQPQDPQPLPRALLDGAVLAVGSVLTFIYLAYVYVRSKSIFVVSIAHIAMNNASMALSYFAVIRDQFLGNLGTVLVMALVVGFLHQTGKFRIFQEYFNSRGVELT